MRVVYWGAYDVGKPRNRIMIRGLRENGVEVIECHYHLWQGVEDKSQITGWAQRVRFLLRWMLAYPGLVVRYLCLARHDYVIVGYMGHIDVVVLWPWAKLRGATVVWDAFLSLYDTIVEDRRLVSRKSPIAWLIRGWEWLACRCAHLILLDTWEHANYFRKAYRLKTTRVAAIPVGAEPEFFPPRPPDNPQDSRTGLTVLFYGQFIPLHGIETIIHAARLVQSHPITFTLIGKGQDDKRVRSLLKACPLPNLNWKEWVPYEELHKEIFAADACLGIFGDTEKAARVIPNKVYQALATETLVITRDSPAIRELGLENGEGICLIAPASPAQLAECLVNLCLVKAAKPRRYASRGVTPKKVGQQLVEVLFENTGSIARVPVIDEDQ